MKRQLKKLTGFVLALALFAQLLVTGSYFDGIKAAEVQGVLVAEDADVSEADGAESSLGSEDQSKLAALAVSDDDYDYYDYDYDYGYGSGDDNYNISPDGRLTWIDAVPADGKLPEGIKIIDEGASWALESAETLIFPEGLEELVLSGRVSTISLPSTLKKLTVKCLTALEELNIPEGVETLILDTKQRYSWDDPCALKTISVPGSVKELEVRSFSDTDLIGNKKYASVKGEDGERYIDNKLVYVPADATKVSIKKGTVSILKGVLSGCGYVATVSIPDTVTSIEEWAFSGTYSLKNVKLPSKLKELGGYAFSFSGIESIEIPKGITRISEGAFYHATSLKSVKMLGKVTEIYSSAFEEDWQLTSINIPKTVKTIGSCAFYGAFSSDSGNAEITIPASVRTIGYKAFASTRQLKKITIKKGLKKIESMAFQNCGFNSITLPASVKEISSDVFAGTNGKVKVAKGSKYLKAYKGGVYADKYSRLIAFPSDNTSLTIHKKCTYIDNILQNTKLKKVTIPDSVERLGWHAFYGSNDLQKVVIGKGTSYIDDTAFYGCDSLTSIEVSSKNKNYSSYKGCLYNADKTRIIAIPWGLKKVNMPDSTTEVQYNILSTRYFGTDSDALEIVLSKNINANNIGNFDAGYEGYYNDRVKLMVNVGSVSASSIAKENTERNENQDSWYSSKPLNYRFIEKDSKILDAIEQGSSTVKVAKGKTSALEYILPAGLLKVNNLVNDTNTECKFTWSSSDTKVATVTDDGTVKGVKAGKATIKATVEMKSGTKRVLEYTVTVG